VRGGWGGGGTFTEMERWGTLDQGGCRTGGGL